MLTQEQINALEVKFNDLRTIISASDEKDVQGSALFIRHPCVARLLSSPHQNFLFSSMAVRIKAGCHTERSGCQIICS